MTERGPISGKEPTKLTPTPPADRLNNEGDIFMAENKGGDKPRGGSMPSAKEQQRAREALGKLEKPEKGASAEEVFTAGYLRRMLSGIAGVPDETADKPDLAKGLPTEREKEVVRISNDPKNDFYAAFEKIIRTSSPEAIKAIVEHQGDAYIGLLVTDLPQDIREKYLAALESVKGLEEGKVRAGLVSIMTNIHDARETAGLPDPLESLGAKRPFLLDKRRREEQEWYEGEGKRRDGEDDEAQLERAKKAGFDGPLDLQALLHQPADPNLHREGASNPYSRIDSVQALADWIIKTQDTELWGPDGAYPLLDEHRNLNQANFMIWLREEAVKRHNDNPNDPMTPLSSVGITTDYREISVYAMSLLREQYLRDEARGDETLKDLASQLIYEGFMFGELRNLHLAYYNAMGNDKEIDKVLQQIHAKNTLTRPGNINMLMTMSEDFNPDKEQGDTRLGDTFRNGLDIYYNLSDSEELAKIFKDHPITQEDFKNVFNVLNKKLECEWNDSENQEYGGFQYKNGKFIYFDREKKGKPIELFDSNGNIDLKTFAQVMNFYEFPTSESTLQKFVREFVRQKAAQKAGLRRTGSLTEEQVESQKTKYESRSGAEKAKFKKDELEKRNARRANMEYAEVMAFSMQRPYGNAAKQDLGRKGYDAMTKMNVGEYLTGQSGMDKGGAIGIPEQLGLFKDISPDMMSGIRTEDGKTIYEIMKLLRDAPEGSAEKKNLLDQLTFRDYAEQNYTVTQQVRAVEIYRLLSDANAINLDKIVTWSYLEGIKYDVAEFQKQINNGLIKPFRYAFINGGLNFGEEVRIYDQQAKAYRSGTLAEKALGKPLYDKLEADFRIQKDKEGKLLGEQYTDFSTFLSSNDARVRIAKNGSLGMLAAQLKSHNRLASLGQTWGYVRSEMLIDALKTVQEYEIDPATGKEVLSVGADGKPKRYYSDEDIKWLRKQSGTEVWRMMLKETGKAGGEALFGGLFESLTKLMGDMAK